MRRYDDPVDVRRGMVTGPGGRQEGPEQFVWRGRLWKVRDVLAHWVETGAWWRTGAVTGVLGGPDPARPTVGELTAEREVWRVEAARGMSQAVDTGAGVFDLTFDWADGSWALTRCAD